MGLKLIPLLHVGAKKKLALIKSTSFGLIAKQIKPTKTNIINENIYFFLAFPVKTLFDDDKNIINMRYVIRLTPKSDVRAWSLKEI
jgi:hypothetical protein